MKTKKAPTTPTPEEKPLPVEGEAILLQEVTGITASYPQDNNSARLWTLGKFLVEKTAPAGLKAKDEQRPSLTVFLEGYLLQAGLAKEELYRTTKRTGKKDSVSPDGALRRLKERCSVAVKIAAAWPDAPPATKTVYGPKGCLATLETTQAEPDWVAKGLSACKRTNKFLGEVSIETIDAEDRKALSALQGAAQETVRLVGLLLAAQAKGSQEAAKVPTAAPKSSSKLSEEETAQLKRLMAKMAAAA